MELGKRIVPVERLDKDAPKEIVDLLQLPYRFFGKVCSEDSSSTLMDIASGEAHQKAILDSLYKEVLFYDYEIENTIVKKADIRNIPLEDKSVDVAFCFETIEHMDYGDQLRALRELKRVTRTYIAIGSVDAFGKDYIGEHIIFKKTNNNMNPYHVRELDSITFPSLLEEVFASIEYYQSVNIDNSIGMSRGLSTRPKSYSNYGLVTL
jgi:hypothetical protein